MRTEIGYARIGDSVLITGPGRVIESLDGSQLDLLQYHEYLADGSKLETRLKELADNQEVLHPPLPEGWKEYEWSKENQPKVNRANIRYFN